MQGIVQSFAGCVKCLSTQRKEVCPRSRPDSARLSSGHFNQLEHCAEVACPHLDCQFRRIRLHTISCEVPADSLDITNEE